MSRLLSTSAVAALLGVALSTPAHADRRAFGHTYEYMTMPEGDLELELYNTQRRSSFDDDATRAFEWQIEIEYGITNRWDVSLYQVFAQVATPGVPDGGSPLAYTKTKVRTRYRFSERGVAPVDTLLYFEIIKPFGVEAWKVEPKVILARDFGKATVALNVILEVEVEKEVDAAGDSSVEVAWEPAWALGATYEASPAFKLGGELFGGLASPGDDNELQTWAGPSASWAPSAKLWISANAGFGLTDDSDAFVFRFLVGAGL